MKYHSYSLPVIPELAPDDGSATDEDWKFTFRKTPGDRRLDFKGHFTPDLKIYEASTSVIESRDDLLEAGHRGSFPMNSQSIDR